MNFEKLGDIAHVTPGTSPKGALINSKRLGLPFFQGSKEFKELYPLPERYTEHPVKVAKSGDVLISVRAPVGEVNFARGDCAIGRGVMSIRAKKESEQAFLFYFLKNLKGEWSSLGSTGSVFENLSTVALNNVVIPDGLNREAIGEILFNLDQKIDVNNSLSKTLEDISQTIFKSWFIDFDPVKAKMVGEKPEGMDDATAALFPDSMEESELGSIPTGWEVKPAADLFEVGIGRTPPRKELQWFCNGTEGVPWVSIRDMGTFGTFSHATNEGLTEAAVVKYKVPVVPENTVLMSFKLTVGKLCISDTDLVTNEAIAHFRISKQSPLDTIFTYLWLRNLDMASLDSTSSIGTATNSGVIKQIRFLVPPGELLEQFHDKVSAIFAQIKQLRRQTTNLVSIRDSLLPRLISGELQIPEEMVAS